MEQTLAQGKFKSIIQRIIRIPLSIFILILLFTVILSFFSFYTMQGRVIDSNKNMLQIAVNQLDNQLVQIDNAYIRYWSEDQSFKRMKNLEKDTPRESYLSDWVSANTWVKELQKTYDVIQGACSYFSNLDRMFFFDGTRKFSMQQYMRDWVRSGDAALNCWRIARIEEADYLVNIRNYGRYYGAAWLALSDVEQMLGLSSEDLLGEPYLIDGAGHSSLRDEALAAAVSSQDEQGQESSLADVTVPGSTPLPAGSQERLRTEKGIYYNFCTGASSEVSLGMLVPAKSLYTNLPLASVLLILITLFCVLLMPFYIVWLQKRLAVPFSEIDRAVQRIGEGDREYRIPLELKKNWDELDRLALRINTTMDQLNELEEKLYISKIHEQRTELKYISQQIRPHFILNALNMMYTCSEEEFPLVKKMILYLTRYFRYIVNLRVDFVEVEKELHHVENYLEIQRLRYGERFDYLVQWSQQAKDLLIPPLILQTFVENCVKYGMKSDGISFIRVYAGVERERLKLSISDTGDGFDEETLRRINCFLETREYSEQLGVGIQNAIERMDILYGGDVKLKIANLPSGGSLIEVYLPQKAG